MDNLCKYRLNDYSWVDEYIEKIGWDELSSYVSRVYNALDILKPGHRYNILKDVPAEKQDLFIKTCCMYIHDHPAYILSNDYTKIEHLKNYYE